MALKIKTDPQTVVSIMEYSAFAQKKKYFAELHYHTLQLHITISPKNIKLNIDCQEVEEKPIKESGNISKDGYEVLGKMAGGMRRQSATVSTRYTILNTALCKITVIVKPHVFFLLKI